MKKEVVTCVYRVVKTVPRGSVTTYGAIGRKCRIHPRLVGRILHQNPEPSLTPCHRVIRSDGTLASGYAFGGRTKQQKLLEQEGVVISRNRVTSYV